VKTGIRIDRVDVRVRGRARASVPAAELSRRIAAEVRDRSLERGAGASALEAALTERVARALGAAGKG
jgi:hypothetical protein